MSILSVLTFPNPILKQKSVDIINFDKQLDQLIEDMFETMDHYNGVGLAAPQIGVLQNLVVIGYQKRRFALINPVIISAEDSSIDEEGCLSCPELTRVIERSDKIVVSATNKKGKKITLKEKGFIARIIQHEIDHLSGILIVEKIPVDLDKDFPGKQLDQSKIIR